jgi:DNA-binding NarL/FixJ family response regulator
MSAVAVATSSEELEVVVVGDHLAIGRGIELLLRYAGFRVTGVSQSAAEATRIIVDRAPDVALVDLGLGDDGLQVIREVKALRPGVALLAYAGQASRERVEAAFAAGASGCALKVGTSGELFDAIRVLAAGGKYVDPRLRSMLSERDVPSRTHLISPREREILGLVATGMTSSQIATGLVLSDMTVQTHVRNAMQKLGAHNRIHAVVLAAAQGEIELETLAPA